MALLNALRSKFAPPARKTWPGVDLRAVEAAISQQRETLAKRQNVERIAHANAEPAATADPAEIVAWEDAGRDMATRHDREVAEFDESYAGLPDEILSLNDLYAANGTRYDELVSALARAEQAAEAAVEPLEAKRQELELAAGTIEASREAIVDRLRALGVNTELNARFDGWEDAVREALLRSACNARNINAERRPNEPDLPNEPRPQVPRTRRSVNERWSIWDLPMIVGGLAFGSSVGAAIGGITFDSDGWHFTPVFWIMLAVATTAAFLIGKMLFPRLTAVRLLDTVDIYPYLKSPEWQTHRERAARAARNATLTLAGVFGVFAGADFYGWWRAVSEQMSARAGDIDTVVLSPVYAGLAVAFLTCLMAGVKLAAVTANVNERRNELLDEVNQLEVDYRNEQRRYKEALERFSRQKAAGADYDRLSEAAAANASFRFQRETTGLKPAIDRYRRKLACANYDQQMAELTRSAEEAASKALAETEGEARNLTEVVEQIDYIHARGKALLERQHPIEVTTRPGADLPPPAEPAVLKLTGFEGEEGQLSTTGYYRDPTR